MDQNQSYATHRRWYPLFHFFVIPVLSINLLMKLWAMLRIRDGWTVWNAILAAAFIALAFTARVMALRVQNRVIRLEERMRLQQILPEDLRGRIGDLQTRQLIAMRFCADAEVPELCRSVLNGEVKTNDEIKRRIKTWRPDTLRA
jgi:hypothetical protein